jgi:hypothetical protein
MTIVSDKMVQDAFDWLNGHADSAAAAKAEKIRAEYRVKVARGRVFGESEGTVAERQAAADCDQHTQCAYDDEAEAVEKDEWHRVHRSKCEAIIEAWRTEQANLRGMTKVG